MTPGTRLPRAVLVTGATGLVGGGVVRRLLESDRDVHVHALVRSPGSAGVLLARSGAEATRITPVIGDVTLPDLGIDSATRGRLSRSVRAVVHAAADTTFSRALADARAVNTAGTGNLLALVAGWNLERFVHVSTAFVAGGHVGAIPESMLSGTAGFVNGYEQSKYEAELLVRASGLPYVIVRPSVIICDDVHGAVTQFNAAHRALRVIHAGLGALMPGSADTPLDLVTAAHVIKGTVALGFASGSIGGSYHLCAGSGAIALGDLLDIAYDIWSRDPCWRRRGILRPALTDLGTYRLFERSVEETGDIRLTTITRSMSHFVPQLALPKRFDSTLADAMLGAAAVPVQSYWGRVVEYLIATRWGSDRSAA
ncbi:MAG TPA: SDR family oxidoreductase [Longimicrobiales bacterium]